ncbi:MULTISPECIES: zinc-binding alcohol dehydrogenase family protein [unclassified Amycolatopsis]|uniref:zinc-binding alcohol dehydrogenase family protein n=1 Tax=unclassified Amycolatopsis TaxID=2618356 RepID=UPI001C6A0C7E|nr:zinc-binding alcohol dehydrogenase family protein [Amycolatopsis sp. DSM 110486]QYN20307.1 zinc-binding alcohol dehydrogenase family protein [Amycolatopsis sp. DSM 110486]
MTEKAWSWRVRSPGSVATGPLSWELGAVPEPAPGELLVRMRVCGVCRTDLHVAEGDLPVHRAKVTSGHEVVGEVVALGAGETGGFGPGDRVGIAWLRSTCGRCRFCLAGRENLCPESAYTGWDADGGYAQYALVPAAFAHHLPAGYPDAELAPLLCAGVIGSRALRRAEVPTGGRLGLYGFGGSAHLAAQVALARGATVHVLTRSAGARRLALELGASSAGGPTDRPPEPLDSAILSAPAGELVPVALEALDRGGTLAVAGIHLSDIPRLNYHCHLFQERQVRTVTANTRAAAREFLRFACEHTLHARTVSYALADAPQALADLAADRVTGAAVLYAD